MREKSRIKLKDGSFARVEKVKGTTVRCKVYRKGPNNMDRSYTAEIPRGQIKYVERY
jgi:hypothetical protein